MFERVALGPDGDAYSIQLHKLTRHTAEGAEELFKTSGLLGGLWVSPGGVVHAAGQRYHTNRTGTFTSSALADNMSSLWGVDDDHVFAGGNTCLYELRNGAWTPVPGLPDASYESLSGTGPSDIYTYATGGVEGLFHFDGTAWTELPLGELYGVSAITCISPDDVLVLGLLDGNSVVHAGNPRAGFRELGRLDHGDCGGVGRGRGGVYMHAGLTIYRNFEPAIEIDEDLLGPDDRCSLAMTSNGTRVVAAGSKSLLVDDGDGFVAWPAGATGKAAKGKPKAAAKGKAKAKARPTKPTRR